MRRITFISVFCVACCLTAGADTWNLPGDFLSIQEAIDAVNSGDTIICGPGNYQENIDFKGKAIHLMSQLGPAATSIDGMQSGSVVSFITGEGPDSIIEGFTITNGKDPFGGGIICNFSSPTITGNIVVGNETDFSGGGICCWLYAEPIITNTIIADNVVNTPFGQGGGLSCWGESNPRIVNCTICKNSSAYTGGGIDVYNSSPVIRNSIIWNNTAPDGASIYVDGGAPNVRYSDVQGGWAGDGGRNIDGDPLFVDEGNNDFHITIDSPCFNGGSNFAPVLPDYDFDGVARDFNGFPDMGVYEYPREALLADASSVSAAAGGTIGFDLFISSEYDGRMYFLLASADGTFPGFIIPGSTSKLALNWDNVGVHILHNYNNATFVDFRGFLDANGDAAATFEVPAGWIPSGMAGKTLDFVYATEYPNDFVSNPIPLDITP